MSRPLRISFNNAVYHITARGNRKEKIFYSDDDKRIFLQKMDQTFLKYSFLCYAYCLMDNPIIYLLRLLWVISARECTIWERGVRSSHLT